MPDFLKLLEMRMQLNAQKNTNNKGPGPNVSGGDVVGGCLVVVGLFFAIFIAIGMFQQETSRQLWWLESLSLSFYGYLLFWPSKLVYATMTVRDSHYLWPVFIIFVYIILSLYWILLLMLYNRLFALCTFLDSFVSVSPTSDTIPASALQEENWNEAVQKDERKRKTGTTPSRVAFLPAREDDEKLRRIPIFSFLFFILRCILFGPLIILALGVVYNILLFIGLSYIKWLESIEGG